MDDLIGKTLDGKYMILDHVGRGGMAAVFLAEQPKMKRRVAIKVLPKEYSYDKTFVARFQQEAEAIASLTHPHILPVHDYGEDEGWTYIVMAYLEGGSLADLIKKEGNTIPFERVLRITRQIADALDYAHGRGIIHRDLKPGNILLDDQGNAYLTDFGIAKLTESTAHLTGSGVVGTPAYMAPEMAGPGGISPKIDIYALGATLFQMLAGRQPYEADTPIGVIMAHATKPIPGIFAFRDGLPEDVQTVISKAMAKDPGERYESAGALVAELEEAASGEKVYQADDPGTLQMVLDGIDAPTKSSEETELLPPKPTAKVSPESNPSFNWLWPVIIGGVMLIGVVLVGAIIVLMMVNARHQATSAAATAVAQSNAEATRQAENNQAAADREATAAADQEIATATAAAIQTADARALLFDQAREWPLVLKETFDDPASESWYIEPNYNDGDFAKGRIVIEDGIYAYFLEAITEQGMVWPEPHRTQMVYEQFYLSVDVQHSGGTATAFYGVVFRYANNTDYYVFEICDNGCVIVSVVRGGYFTTLHDQSTDAVKSGEVNTLEVIGDGDYFACFVNGILVAEVIDDQISNGGIGVIGEIYGGMGTGEWRFDNVIVRVP